MYGNLNLNGASTSATITDVAKNLTEKRFTTNGGGSDAAFTGDFEYLENGGFVVEKYLVVEEHETPVEEVTERDSNLFGIVNMEDWKAWIEENDNFNFVGSQTDEETGEESDIETSREIGELFKSWRYGLRLCYVPSIHAGPALLAKTRNISDEYAKNNKAFKVDLNDSRTNAFVPLIPIAKTEIEIPAGLRIGDFDVVEDYDFDCLVEQFLEDAEFKALFEYTFSLERFLSVPTIYMAHCFLHSIGLDDDWYTANRPGDVAGLVGEYRGEV